MIAKPDHVNFTDEKWAEMDDSERECWARPAITYDEYKALLAAEDQPAA